MLSTSRCLQPGIYDKGWPAVTRHSTPWVITELPPFANDTWELYDTSKDWSQAHDLAAEMPEKLAEPKASGTHQVRMEFAYDGGGLGKGGTATLYVDGTKTGEGRVEATVPMIYSADEACDVGSDAASPVSDDYASEDGRYNGTVQWARSTSPRRPTTSTT
jgi:hypothetical protein